MVFINPCSFFLLFFYYPVEYFINKMTTPINKDGTTIWDIFYYLYLIHFIFGIFVITYWSICDYFKNTTISKYHDKILIFICCFVYMTYLIIFDYFEYKLIK